MLPAFIAQSEKKTRLKLLILVQEPESVHSGSSQAEAGYCSFYLFLVHLVNYHLR